LRVLLLGNLSSQHPLSKSKISDQRPPNNVSRADEKTNYSDRVQTINEETTVQGIIPIIPLENYVKAISGKRIMIQRYEREAKREETVLDKLKKTRPKSSIVQIIQKCENQREWVFHFQQADVN
jgi:hypothetical protein